MSKTNLAVLEESNLERVLSRLKIAQVAGNGTTLAAKRLTELAKKKSDSLFIFPDGGTIGDLTKVLSIFLPGLLNEVDEEKTQKISASANNQQLSEHGSILWKSSDLSHKVPLTLEQGLWFLLQAEGVLFQNLQAGFESLKFTGSSTGTQNFVLCKGAQLSKPYCTNLKTKDRLILTYAMHQVIWPCMRTPVAV
jgi:hypothetical protein